MAALLSSESAMCLTFPIYAEAIALLLRRRNGGDISPLAFQTAVDVFEQDILSSGRFRVLETDTELTLASIPLILRHNLNSSDAAILATYLEYIASEPQLTPLFVCPEFLASLPA